MTKTSNSKPQQNYNGAVLFDLDGTLVDTAADFISVVNRMLIEDGKAILDSKLIRNTVSDGARALVKLAYQLNEGEEGFEELKQRLLDSYDAFSGTDAKPFSGITDLLRKLENNNIAWAVVTNKPERFTTPLLQRLELQPSRGIAICPDHVKQTKPAPEPLLLAASKLDLRPEQCLYAGDHIRDIAAGNAANMKTLACEYGYIKEDDDISSWQADLVCQQVSDLTNAICEHFNI